MPDGFPLAIGFRRSRRAKHLRLVVKPSGVELVLPPTIDEARALEFLRRHQDWVERKLGEMRKTAEGGTPKPLVNGATIPFQGREVALEVSEVKGRRARVEFDGRFRVFLPAESTLPGEHLTRAALFAWVRHWLQAEAGRIIALHAGHCGLHPGSIRVKRMKSRWGSCGARNDISLNWLLAFVPPTVLEYVVVHELCHIRHRDHSIRFWHLVAQHLPRYADERQWLRSNGGALLHRFEG